MKAMKMLEDLKAEIMDLYKKAGIEYKEGDEMKAEHESMEEGEGMTEPNGEVKGKVTIMKTKFKPVKASKLAEVLGKASDEEEMY